VIDNYHRAHRPRTRQAAIGPSKKRLAEAPAIGVPTFTFQDDANGTVEHYLPQKATPAFAEAIVDVSET
jgi:hypothetical protein